MEHDLILAFKKHFETEIGLRQDSRSKLKEVLHDLRDTPVEFVERATEYTANILRLTLSKKDAYYLKSVEAALERIKDGTFGLCQYCEEEIDIRRLRANPTARLCFLCQLKAESKTRA